MSMHTITEAVRTNPTAAPTDRATRERVMAARREAASVEAVRDESWWEWFMATEPFETLAITRREG